MADLLETMKSAVGSLTYAATMLEAPVGSHMRTVIVELAEARKDVEAMIEALENMERILWDLACYVEESRQEPEKEAIDACVAARELIARAKGN